jgi:hypothetical protein
VGRLLSMISPTSKIELMVTAAEASGQAGGEFDRGAGGESGVCQVWSQLRIEARAALGRAAFGGPGRRLTRGDGGGRRMRYGRCSIVTRSFSHPLVTRIIHACAN